VVDELTERAVQAGLGHLGAVVADLDVVEELVR
jgi:hypothetical protein